eukprot:TRINITY_DN5584_c0_g1_i2.p1 TRINITY_DN5584_c0_g1~~TRINITY_DN5584_c0_g1_i2.p1  ORF type:complete len:382 (-),score=69.46 TRINITY_DN5584_c0_g1_i2:71-1216(-)
MATTARASCILPLPLWGVWPSFRDFSQTPLLISCVSKVEVSEGHPLAPGCIRTVHWNTGETRSHRLIEISDLNHSISWELVAADPPLETMAVTTRVSLYSVSETNHTMVEWEGDFAANTAFDFLQFEQKAYQHNLNDIRSALTKTPPPLLYHILEGPSTRVLWTAAALGLPLRVKIITPAPVQASLDPHHAIGHQMQSSTELSAEKGGVVACLQLGEGPDAFTLYESGTIVQYLIDRYDSAHSLDPFPLGSRERAKYLQWFFYSSSTADHLLFEAYKQMHVLPASKKDPAFLRSLHMQWERQIVGVFEEALMSSPYLCGSALSGADIMAAWSLQLADLLGWLEGRPTLERYVATIRSSPMYKKAARADPSSSLDCAPFYIV